MDLLLQPCWLHGVIAAPPSKSAAHRAILCAALADGLSEVSPISPSDDMEATIRAVQALGTVIGWEDNRLKITGTGSAPIDSGTLNCGESGSTLRFLLPVAAALGANCSFTGTGRLPERPIGTLTALLSQNGIHFSSYQLPFNISGKLKPGTYTLPGDISSQFVSGLLFALPLLEGDSEIILTSPLQSKGYVDMTMDMLARFGVLVYETKTGYKTPGKQHYRAKKHQVESDYSSAAFWLCAAALGADITVQGLNSSSLQGDMAVLNVLKRFGATVEESEFGIKVTANQLNGCVIDAAQIPDLVPILAVVASFAKGETRIVGAQRLRIKESDRLAATNGCLQALGADICELPDGLIIHGKNSLPGGETDSWNDHRMAMAMAIASTRCQGSVTLHGAQAVKKSYPDFFECFQSLGGNFQVL